MSAEDRVSKALESSTKDYPRLFFDKKIANGFSEKIKESSYLQSAFAYIKKGADAVIDAAPTKRIVIGKRLLSESRKCLRRVTFLAMTYLVTGDKKYVKRAETEMLAAAKFKDWNPSHFLDVAEMTAALAIGYDWLYHELDSQAKEEILKAIISKGLIPSKKFGRYDNINNWNQVCNCGIVLGALVAKEKEPEQAAFIIRRAINGLPVVMKEYEPDGAYPEGPMYWEYGTTFNILNLAAFESVFKDTFGLSNFKGFFKSSTYMAHVTGPRGEYFNYSDCSSSKPVSSALVWMARTLSNGSLLHFEEGAMDRLKDKEETVDTQANRLLPFVIVWYKHDMFNTKNILETSWVGNGQTPVATHRSGWSSNDEVYIAIKGGSASSPHGHMDSGSFILESQGVRWFLHLPMQTYHFMENLGINLWDLKQDSDRWKIFRYTNKSKNLMVVDDKLHDVNGFAKIIKHQSKPEFSFSIVDLKELYKNQLADAKRGVALLQDKNILVQDEILTNDKSAQVRWAFCTQAEVKVLKDNEIKFSQEGKTILMRILEPEDVKVEIIDISKPINKWDKPNEGASLVSFTLKIPAKTKQKMAVLIQTGPNGLSNYHPTDLMKW